MEDDYWYRGWHQGLIVVVVPFLLLFLAKVLPDLGVKKSLVS